MTRGTPDEEYYKLTREDELKLKTLLKYAFADSPTFDTLTDIERGILGDKETFVRIVSWSCEGERNEYVGAPNLSSPIEQQDIEELPTVTLEELKQGSHELRAFPKVTVDPHLLDELLE